MSSASGRRGRKRWPSCGAGRRGDSGRGHRSWRERRSSGRGWPSRRWGGSARLEAGIHQGVDDDPRGTFDRDVHGGRRAELTQPADQLGQSLGRVRHRAAPPDRPVGSSTQTACAVDAQSRPTKTIASLLGTARHCAVRGPAGRSLIGALGWLSSWRCILWPVGASRHVGRGSGSHRWPSRGERPWLSPTAGSSQRSRSALKARDSKKGDRPAPPGSKISDRPYLGILSQGSFSLLRRESRPVSGRG